MVIFIFFQYRIARMERLESPSVNSPSSYTLIKTTLKMLKLNFGNWSGFTRHSVMTKSEKVTIEFLLRVFPAGVIRSTTTVVSVKWA